MGETTTKDVTLAVIAEQIKGIDSKLTRSLEKLDEHDATLYGEKNAAGLVGHFAELDHRLSSLEATLRWIAGVLITLVIGLVWGLITGTITIVK